MTATSDSGNFKWEKDYLLKNPLKTLGVIFVLVLRYCFGAYFLLGAMYKFSKDWLWTNKLQIVFQNQLANLNRLNEFYVNEFSQNLSAIEPDAPLYALEPLYLEHFAIPFYLLIAWTVTLGELVVAISLILGITVRLNAAIALFILINFAAGGYFQFHTSIPLMSFALLFMCLPSGQWLGLDKKFDKMYPDTMWFK